MSNNIPFPRQSVAEHKISDNDYRLMIETVTDYAIFMLDTGGFIQNWNAGAQAMKGYTADEIIGQHFSIFYPPELLERNWTDFELATAREQGRYQEEGWRIRKDGSRFWASVVITKLVDADGRFRGFSKITRDLSERRQQEETLRSSEERFRLLVEGVTDYAIFMLDPAGVVISWNKGAHYAKGYEAAEIIGKHFSVFYPPDVAASGFPDLELRKAIELGHFEDEGWRVRKDGSRFWANVVITALFDPQGRHRGFAKVTRDLTEKRRTEMLEAESRRITAFITMLAHELRNPLAPIGSAVAILGKEPNLSSKGAAARDILGRQSQQMTRLVDDLLDMSRIVEGKIHLDAKAVQLDTVIHDAANMIDPFMQLQSHTVTIDTGSEPIWVNGDATRLTQIVSNLLHNAAKFTPQCGAIRVSLFAQDDIAAIAVTDNGMGIDPSRLTQVFDRFKQSDSDVSKTFGGLGLGLSLSQELAHLQQGTLTAFSTGVNGEGSIFTLRLPRIPAPAQVAESQVASKTVLVVDDNHDSANVTAMLLETMGFECKTAYTGKQAIETIIRERPGVVLLDIGLPDIDGHGVARHVLAHVADPPPMVAVTGYGEERDRERSLKAGFYAHVTKPVDTDKLEVLLHLLLSKR